MNPTGIEWVVNPDGSRPGYTTSPITGCLKGCEWCFANNLAQTRLRHRYLANPHMATGSPWPLYRGNPYQDPFYPRFWPERLDSIPSRGKPRGIFLNDMGEWAGDWVPAAWQQAMFLSIITHPKHRFYLLTKQYHNLARFSPYPPNCWVGFSATNEEQLRAGLSAMSAVKATVKFVSLEPYLERISRRLLEYLYCVSWVIVGGRSSINKTGWDQPFYPPLDWLADIRRICADDSIPLFEKDNIRPSAACYMQSRQIPGVGGEL